MRMRKGWRIAIVLIAGFFLLLAAGLHYASSMLKTQIEAALGEPSSVGEISLGLFSVTISDLRIKAPAGWPAAENLHARRIVVAPDWLSFLSPRIGVRYIHADGVNLAVLRDTSGRLRLLPGLLERKSDDKPMPEVTIGEILLSDSSLDFYDASIRRPPYRVRLEKVAASLGQLNLPAMDGRSPLELSGVIQGAHGEGSYHLKGDIELASFDSDLVTTMRNVDLTALRPYLLRSADTGVKRGWLDLDLRSVVLKRRLNAQGTLVLHDLVLDSGDSILGQPRQAVVNMLKNNKRDIRMKFSLQGNLDDPSFSINESLATRFSAGLAETLGVNIGGLGEVVGNAAASVGSALRGLFGK